MRTNIDLRQGNIGRKPLAKSILNLDHSYIKNKALSGRGEMMENAIYSCIRVVSDEVFPVEV